jgi:hypothetical protein
VLADAEESSVLADLGSSPLAEYADHLIVTPSRASRLAPP